MRPLNLLSMISTLLVAFAIQGTNADGSFRGASSRGLEEVDQREPIREGDKLKLSSTQPDGATALDNETPHLGVNYIIALQGAFPERSGGTQANGPMMGEIRMFGGNFPPAGWAFCEGQLLAISSNSALFSILGTTYGGDGRTTFGLPDMRGRAAVHQDNNHRLGYFGGTDRNTLTSSHLPSQSEYIIESVEAPLADP